MPNLFSNKNVFVCFRDPIDVHLVDESGGFFLREGQVEVLYDGFSVLKNSQLVELHPLSETRDKRLKLDLKL